MLGLTATMSVCLNAQRIRPRSTRLSDSQRNSSSTLPDFSTRLANSDRNLAPVRRFDTPTLQFFNDSNQMLVTSRWFSNHSPSQLMRLSA